MWLVPTRRLEQQVEQTGTFNFWVLHTAAAAVHVVNALAFLARVFIADGYDAFVLGHLNLFFVILAFELATAAAHALQAYLAYDPNAAGAGTARPPSILAHERAQLTSEQANVLRRANRGHRRDGVREGNTVYTQMLRANINPVRWLEYAVTAALILVGLARLSGVRDPWQLASIAVLVSATMFTGLWNEHVHVPKVDTPRYHHTSGAAVAVLFYGWLFIAFAVAGPIWSFVQAAQDGSAPDFVYVLVFGTYGAYLLFGIVPLLKHVAGSRNYWRLELVYIALSLTTKVFFVWVVAEGVLGMQQ